MVQMNCMTIATGLAVSTILLTVESMTKFSINQTEIRHQSYFLPIKLLQLF